MTVNKLIEILQSLPEHEKEQEILIEGHIWSPDGSYYINKRYFTMDISDKNDLKERTYMNNITKEYRTWKIISCYSEDEDEF